MPEILVLALQFFILGACVSAYAFRLAAGSSKQRRNLILFLAIAFILPYAETSSALEAFAVAIGFMIFATAAFSEKFQSTMAYLALSVLFILSVSSIGIILVSQSLLFGIMAKAFLSKKQNAPKKNTGREIRRDFVHMVSGILFVSLFLLAPIPYPYVILIAFILCGILFVSYANTHPKAQISRSIYSLEREGTAIGYGAVWLAVGSLISVSFLSQILAVVPLAAIFIGDPMATMVGLYFKGPKLPYNRKKSVSGASAFFISTAAIAYPIIGFYSIPVALAAALAESIPTSIDDNFYLPIIVIIMLLLPLFI
jgi:dolichol kinase